MPPPSRFEWLVEARTMATGVTGVGDVLYGGGLGLMMLHKLAGRASVDVQLMANPILSLKTAEFGPDVMHQLEDAQAHTPDLWAPGAEGCGQIGGPEDLLMGLLLGLARLAINRSRQWTMKGAVSANWLSLFLGYVRTWVSSESEHVASNNALEAFRE
eukprot:g46660.t1